MNRNLTNVGNIWVPVTGLTHPKPEFFLKVRVFLWFSEPQSGPTSIKPSSKQGTGPFGLSVAAALFPTVNYRSEV